MRMLSLFSGIGGIDLAARWAGIETVAFCEIDPFCQKVLRKHWPRVPIFGDIKTLIKEVLDDAGIGGIDIVAGSDPCQPYSQSGKRKGEDDDRFLWPEMFSIVSDIRPPWFVRENVVGNITLGLDRVLADLESIGYSSRTFDLSAAAVGLPTVERHVWTVSAPNSIRFKGNWQKSLSNYMQLPQLPRGYQRENYRWDIPEARVCRVGERVPNRIHRLKALGNAVVPQQIYPIFAAIAAIEQMRGANDD